MTITDIPRVQLRIEGNGVFRAMFVNPNEGLEETPPEVINILRVYYATHASLPLAVLEDIPLPFDVSNQITQLTFTPSQPGYFKFAWAHVTVTPVADIEGPLSPPGEIVYGRLDTITRTINQTQGCFTTVLTTSQLMTVNSYASKMFESYAGWHFYPKYLSIPTSGEDSYDLSLPVPIIQVNEIWNRTSGIKDTLMDASLYVVYNRHMLKRKMYDPASPLRPDGFLEDEGDGSGGMTSEDDRRDPKISFNYANEYGSGGMHVRSGGIRPQHLVESLGSLSAYHGYKTTGFHRGRQNLVIKGLFGFTEPDMSTPPGVVAAVEKMALRQATLEFGNPDEIDTVMNAHRVIMDKTDTHTIMYEAKDRLGGFFTGDPFIDSQISIYSRNAAGSFV